MVMSDSEITVYLELSIKISVSTLMENTPGWDFPGTVNLWCSASFFLPLSQHKKLVEGTLYEEVTSASYSENDISNSLKNGILYLEDPIDHVSLCKLG